MTFAYTWRWPQLDQDIVDPAKGEKRDRDLEGYLYAPPQAYPVNMLLSTGGTTGHIAPTTGFWERQRGQFVTVRCDWLVTANGSDPTHLIVLPLPGSAAPAAVDLGGSIGRIAFPPGGVAVGHGGSNPVYFPFLIAVGGTLGVGFIDAGTGVKLSESTSAAGLVYSAVVCYREKV